MQANIQTKICRYENLNFRIAVPIFRLVLIVFMAYYYHLNSRTDIQDGLHATCLSPVSTPTRLATYVSRIIEFNIQSTTNLKAAQLRWKTSQANTLVSIVIIGPH